MKSITSKAVMLLMGTALIFALSACKSDGKNGEVSLDSFIVTIPDDISPVADAGPDQTVEQGTAITLDGSESDDEDGQIVSYEWKLPDGTAVGSDPIMGRGVLPVGTHTFVLIVTDDRGATGVDSVDITVAAPAPEPDHDPCFTYRGKTYCNVTSPHTGKVWLDRNLGANQVCTAYNDTACYGDYYQWGRNADGHEKIGSGETITQEKTIDPGHGDFIKGSSDWTSADADGHVRSGRWGEEDGTSVCPTGYRVPTIDDLRAELFASGADIDGNTPSADKRENAFASFLKLPSAGFRDDTSGTLNVRGSWGLVWSLSVSGFEAASNVRFVSDVAGWYDDVRATGSPVRCLRDMWSSSVSGSDASNVNFVSDVAD